MARTFADALQDALRLLNSAGVRYAVSGGVAMGLYGLPRFTKDLDLLVLAEEKQIERALAPTFAPIFSDAFEDVSGFIVEAYLARTPLELAMLDRAREAPLGSQVVRVLDPVDWVGLKLREARRAPVEADRHLADVRAVVRELGLPPPAVRASAERLGAAEQYDLLGL